MARNKDFDTARVAARLGLENLEELHHPTPVPAGAAHQLQAHLIGLALIITAELHEDAIREKSGGRLCGVPAPAVAKERPQESQSKICHDAFRELACRVALRNVRAAADGLRQGTPLEFVAFDVTEAIENVSAVLGESAAGAVLDRIFSQFCIGK